MGGNGNHHHHNHDNNGNHNHNHNHNINNNNHNYDNQRGQQQQQQHTVMAPPQHNTMRGPQMPLGGAKGPVYQPQEQLQTLHYCIHSNPSWHQTCILGFQHYIVMLGTTVLISSAVVPLMGGNAGDKAHVIQSLLFMSAINTLLQTLIGSRLPAVMGPSYVYLIPVMTIINDNNNGNFNSEHQRFVHNIRTIQGSLIISSFVSIILGYSKAWGNLTRLFSPLVIVPIVSLVGLGLFTRGFPQLANCVEIGLPMLVLLVLVQQYAKHLHQRAHPILERFSLLLCIGLIWAFAAILTVAGVYNRVKEQTKMSCRTDRSSLISSSPWVKVPYPFQWGSPIFSASSVFGMMGAALVSSAETTATFYATARLSGATPPPAHVLSRSIGLQVRIAVVVSILTLHQGMLWAEVLMYFVGMQGISMLLDGLFGTVVGTTATV